MAENRKIIIKNVLGKTSAIDDLDGAKLLAEIQKQGNTGTIDIDFSSIEKLTTRFLNKSIGEFLIQSETMKNGRQLPGIRFSNLQNDSDLELLKLVISNIFQKNKKIE